MGIKKDSQNMKGEYGKLLRAIGADGDRMDAVTAIVYKSIIMPTYAIKHPDTASNRYSLCDISIFTMMTVYNCILVGLYHCGGNRAYAAKLTSGLIDKLTSGISCYHKLPYRKANEMVNNRVDAYEAILMSDLPLSKKLDCMFETIVDLCVRDSGYNDYKPYDNDIYISDVFEELTIHAALLAYYKAIHDVFKSEIDTLIAIVSEAEL